MTTLERSREWIRETVERQEKPIQVTPERRWTYYLAIIIAIALLIGLVTGLGATLIVKGQNVIQHYIERMYGLAD